MFPLILFLTAATSYALFDFFTSDDDDHHSSENEGETVYGSEDDLLASEDYRQIMEESDDFDDAAIDRYTFLDGSIHVDTAGGDDDIIGSAGDDIIHTRSGNDSVFGGEGDDVIHLGDGDDYSAATKDAIRYRGSFEFEEAETLHAGDDHIDGGRGNDRIEDWYGSNTIYGRQGNDFISTVDRETVESTPDVVFGGYGSDTIRSDDGDVVTTGEGRDEILVEAWFIADGLEPVTITDFDPERDRLILEGDDGELRRPAPTGPDDVVVDPITVVDYEDGTGATVFVSGIPVVHLNGGQGFGRYDLTLST